MRQYIVNVRITDVTTGCSFSRKVSTYAKSLTVARCKVLQFLSDEFLSRCHTYEFSFGNVVTNTLETSFL